MEDLAFQQSQLRIEDNSECDSVAFVEKFVAMFGVLALYLFDYGWSVVAHLDRRDSDVSCVVVANQQSGDRTLLGLGEPPPTRGDEPVRSNEWLDLIADLVTRTHDGTFPPSMLDRSLPETLRRRPRNRTGKSQFVKFHACLRRTTQPRRRARKPLRSGSRRHVRWPAAWADVLTIA
jgi:hypothetical protein